MDDQIRHYENKLNYETDSWDLNDAIQHGEKIVVIDARSAESVHRRTYSGGYEFAASDDEPRNYIALGSRIPLCDILRRHRLQRINERRTQYGTVRISREGAYWRLGLVEARRLSPHKHLKNAVQIHNQPPVVVAKSWSPQQKALVFI